MTMILNQFGRPFSDDSRLARIDRAASLKSNIRARYDAAQTNDRNKAHWANADSLSANAAANPEILRKLRYRSRYEFANNGSLQRMALTLANDVIGTGPRLQMRTADPTANKFIETLWASWVKVVHLGPRLRLGRVARAIDGAALAVKSFNPGLPHPVKLDVRLRDYDRLTSGTATYLMPGQVDGIVFDQYDNPVEYHILRQHPGDIGIGLRPGDVEKIPARHVIHWFDARRPEQDRGVPEVTSVLPLFAQQRRYREAVLTSAEIAALLAGVIHTNSNVADPASAEEVGDALQMEIGQFLTLPEGWDVNQMKAEQPTTTFPSFNEENDREKAAAFLMPLNIARGDSSKMNYASGRMDHQGYFQSNLIERSDCEEFVLDPLFVDWMLELSLLGLIPDVPALTAQQKLPQTERLRAAAGYLDLLGCCESLSDWLQGGDQLPTLSDIVRGRRYLMAAGYGDEAAVILQIPHEWFWDGRQHVDPSKEANAQQTRLRSGTTTLTREYAQQGIDIETADQEAARENGVSVEEYRRRRFESNFPSAIPPAPSQSSAPSSRSATTQAEASRSELIAAFNAADEETQEAVEALLSV